MYIVQFTHPQFINSQSMPRFARMIADAMYERGHTIETWTAKPIAYRLPISPPLKKWLGYIDQFIIFPLQVLRRLRKLPENTIFVFSDQALGPWVPLVANRPHAIHAHDFLALRSALGEFQQNPASWTGRQYQSFIRRGFAKGHNFISVSKSTRQDLHRFLSKEPAISEVIYNGLNFPYRPMGRTECEAELLSIGQTLPTDGFLLHVGGNQWYKNREGVLEIYLAYAKQTETPLPILMIGAQPTERMKKLAQGVNGKGDIRFLTGLTNEQLCAAYSAARLLIFPSLAEGFGWPIAEAMACGCPVLTTDQAPMTEVGGNAAFYVPAKPVENVEDWAKQAGERILEILTLSADEIHTRRQQGYDQVIQFDTKRTLDAYERIYQQVLERGNP